VCLFIIFFLYILNPVQAFQAFEYGKHTSSFSTFFSDFGAKAGFGMFRIMLAVIGIFATWSHKKKIYPLYIAIIMLVASSFFFELESMIYLNILTAVFSAFGFYYLMDSTWEVDMLHTLTVFIIISGILLSVLSFSFSLADSGPSISTVKSLRWLRENTGQEIKVLSAPENGYYIEYIARRGSVIDNLDIIYENEEVEQDYRKMVNSINLEDTKTLFDSYDVSYILVNERFNPSILPPDDIKGLFFLFRNNETFKKAYEDEDVVLYEVLA